MPAVPSTLVAPCATGVLALRRHQIQSTMLAPIIGVNTINAPAQNMPSDSASSFIRSWIIGGETG